jgi:hypothetical protein
MNQPPQDSTASGDADALNKLVNHSAKLDEDIAEAEAKLKDLKAAKVDLLQKHIPAAMTSMRMTEYTSTEGYRVKLTEMRFGKIQDKEAANEWLMESGNGGIIKRQVTVKLNYEEDDKSCALLKELQERGLQAELKDAVNHQILNGFVRECHGSGIELPESIKVTTIKEAKIKHVI